MRQRVKTLFMWSVLILMLMAAVSGVGSISLQHQAAPAALLQPYHSIAQSRTQAPRQSQRMLARVADNTSGHMQMIKQAIEDSRLGKNQRTPVATATPATSENQAQQQQQDLTIPPDALPTDAVKFILINITNQWMYVYQDGAQIANTPITTGRPGLDTPIGTFHIFNKASPTTFVSMWPPGSPNYFAPTYINFALEFLNPGYFIHDSLWRNVYGPGSNTPHYVAGYGTESGSHGCVNVPYSTMSWLYNWADIGTTVQLSY
ncbi:L,D-transpeptidase [Dictyobacter arantiisoli]|uniref:L,D-TPase catalytic domain-containing protein n=1 Tax=Dictyobacter arantiisoli TaxID=2014874 RepID=A0A5A5TB13_9CHLR|nr:L,D-transpeptidase [Dictyobacter arantiisoli]GCF08435.1 hypothetical protein KDI_19990 [Dictyobacter arantiisoli]